MFNLNKNKYYKLTLNMLQDISINTLLFNKLQKYIPVSCEKKLYSYKFIAMHVVSFSFVQK